MSTSHNRLAQATSPYLRQHADNPVDWYPWGEEAFAAARHHDKPLFLSIGYATCHWCHVMAEESFEDEEVAARLNETFICIKVDREERPDIDHFYLSVAQAMAGTGGWPLTIMMTPDKKPFFAATYISKHGRFGRPGLLALIDRISGLWSDHRTALTATGDSVLETISRQPSLAGPDISQDTLDDAFQALGDTFDGQHGGFGDAPKFPLAHHLLFLLRYGDRTGNAQAFTMVETTLDAMRRGGIYDHVGFGFHRYATDQFWLVPHFEKMLYDQALLAITYCEAFQAIHHHRYAATAREIFTYVLRDLRSPERAFYAAQDADSKGGEGAFYLWTMDDVKQVLEPQDVHLATQVFGLNDKGNFADPVTGQVTLHNILHQPEPLQKLADDGSLSLEQLDQRLTHIRQQLFAVRQQRPAPPTDENILTDWNGLMIAALAIGARTLQDKHYAEAAADALAAVRHHLMPAPDQLHHRLYHGEAGVPGLLTDYVFLSWGLLELYAATYESHYLSVALDLGRVIIDRFWDANEGGLFLADIDTAAVSIQQKDYYDGSIPSGNAMAAHVFFRLGQLTGDASWEEYAARLARSIAASASAQPTAHTHLLSAIDRAFGPSYEVVITGDLTDSTTRTMLHTLETTFLPRVTSMYRPPGEHAAIDDLAPFVAAMRPKSGGTTAYVCSGDRCHPPVKDIESVMALLGHPVAPDDVI